MENEQINKDWLKEEVAEIERSQGDRTPSLKLEENKIVILKINFSKPFEKWMDTTDPKKIVIKKKIPVEFNGEQYLWWLNIKNPVYHEIAKAGLQGKTEFKILQIGNKKDTKYIIQDDKKKTN